MTIRQYITNKYILFLFALSIIVFSLWYTHQLATIIEHQEEEAANILASAYQVLNDINATETELNSALEVVKKNKNIPVIWTNQQKQVIAYKNFNADDRKLDKGFFKLEIAKLENKHNFIIIKIDANEHHYLFYKDSLLLQKLKKFPVYQLSLITLFFLLSFIAFKATKKAEQNQLWVGLAKETAHQLGTPLSSLSAWVEILKDKLKDDDDFPMVIEMEKDIDRLDLVAKRFSKIGSPPELHIVNLSELVQNMVSYMEKRAAYNINFSINDLTEGKSNVLLNQQLFEWVIENLLKNALDAMDAKGKIDILIFDEPEHLIIEIKDTGKGISKQNFETIFQAGYSTKKRGWGLGLALSKRIVEEYHKGKILVKDSVINKGTTFRIELKV